MLPCFSHYRYDGSALRLCCVILAQFQALPGLGARCKGGGGRRKGQCTVHTAGVLTAVQSTIMHLLEQAALG